MCAYIHHRIELADTNAITNIDTASPIETAEIIIPAVAMLFPSPPSSADFLYPSMLSIKPTIENKKDIMNPTMARVLLSLFPPAETFTPQYGQT